MPDEPKIPTILHCRGLNNPNEMLDLMLKEDDTLYAEIIQYFRFFGADLYQVKARMIWRINEKLAKCPGGLRFTMDNFHPES